MKIKFPPFLKKNPFDIFDRFQTPVFVLVIIGSLLLRAWEFGKSGEEDFSIILMMIGLYAVELLVLVVFIFLGGRRITQLGRFTILYLAFVPKLKFIYLQRITDIKLLFELREDLTNGRTKNAIALWYPELSKFLLLMVPFILILIMALRTGNENIGEVKLLTKGFIISIITAIVLGILALPFGNYANLGSFIISIILVSCIWKLWEGLRDRKSYEPMPVVAWAEILLFLAMWLKGIVESF